jgi:hypothetical protein
VERTQDDDPAIARRSDDQGQADDAVRGSAGMMEKLISEAGRRVTLFTQKEILLFARHWDELFGRGAAKVDGDEIVIRAPGATKRWLTDPSLRFRDRSGK